MSRSTHTFSLPEPYPKPCLRPNDGPHAERPDGTGSLILSITATNPDAQKSQKPYSDPQTQKTWNELESMMSLNQASIKQIETWNEVKKGAMSLPCHIVLISLP